MQITFLPYILPLFLATQSVLAATPEEWCERTIYQIVTDRFAREDNQAYVCDTSKRQHCGGSWKGITNHLDYIQNLGFDAIWISPIVMNVNGTTAYGEAYHGYWTQNMYELNHHFGTAEDLLALSKALHTRGMLLMLDVVVNHFAGWSKNSSAQQDLLPDFLDFSLFSPFSSKSDFHPPCEITDFGNQTNVEQCWLGTHGLPLPDLNTEDPQIVQTLYAWINKLIKDYGADGLRIDTVKHIRKDFWSDFVKSAGVFTIGEVINDKPSYMEGYTEVLDSVLDYPSWYALQNAFGSTFGNLSALVDIVTTSQKLYKNGLFKTGSFLENHDQPRFQSVTQDQSLIRNAMVWPFVQDGIPILYYGQEQGFQGGSDPSNREAMWSSGYETQKPLVALVRALNMVRKVAIASNKDFLTTQMKFIPQPDYSTLVVSKPPLLALLTNIGANPKARTTWTIPASTNLIMSNGSMVDVLTCKVLKADSDGQMSINAESGMPRVLIPSSLLKHDGELCPGQAPVLEKNGIIVKRASWTVVGSAIIASGMRYIAGYL